MSSKRPLVSLITPAFNEASIIESNLAELHRHALKLRPKYDFELIVVNDGSIDDTGALAEAFAAHHPNVCVYHHTENRGLGAALQTALKYARGEVCVALDLDLSYAPYHIPLLLRAREETQAAIVLASPYIRGGTVVNVPWLRKTLSAWANRFLSIATGGKVATLTCMVRAYDTMAVRRLPISADNMDFNYEIVFAALRKKMPIAEIPARLEWRRSCAAVSRERRPSMKVFSHFWSVLTAGFRYRPSMLLTLPGVVPGLLPLVLSILYLIRPSQTVIINATAGTIAVQLLSLAFFGVLTSSYLWRLRSLSTPSRVRSDLACSGRLESRPSPEPVVRCS